MRRFAYIAIAAISALSIQACDNAPEIWYPEAADLCGRWVCTVKSGDVVKASDAKVITTNTAANDNNIWVQYGGANYKCAGKIDALTFEGENVSNGAIFKDAVKVKPLEMNGDPIAVDSIAFTLKIKDGEFSVTGHRFTGWEKYVQ